VAKGQITPEEGERLLALLDKDAGAGKNAGAAEEGPKPKPKYLRVVVESDEGYAGDPGRVNVRVPMQFLRAGVRLASLLPVQARGQVNEAFRRNGLDFDISQIKPENLEELVDQLNDLTVDVDQKHNRVRVFCE